MNEMIMLTELGCDSNEHICVTCEKMYKVVRRMKPEDAEEAMHQSCINSGGCPDAQYAKENGENVERYMGMEIDANNGCFVIKCPEYKFCREVYDGYIRSDEWRKKAYERMKKDGFKCVKCGSPINLQCHHLTYDRLGREPLTDIITLCKKCHSEIHGKE